MPASGSQPKSPSPERKQKNNELPQTTPDENNEAKHEDDMALRKSRTLSAPPTRNLTLSVEKNVKLSSDQRCSSMEAVTMDDNPSEVTQRKNTKAKSQFRMSIPVNKKRLKAMFKSNKEEHVPKIEVSGPITCDIMGSAANDDYMVPISKSPKNDEHSEHPYDQVAVDRNHCVKNGDKEREGVSGQVFLLLGFGHFHFGMASFYFGECSFLICMQACYLVHSYLLCTTTSFIHKQCPVYHKQCHQVCKCLYTVCIAN